MRITAFQTRISMLVVLIVVLSLGCWARTTSTASIDSKANLAREKVRDAQAAVVDLAVAKREEYVATMQKQLDALNSKYQVLKDRAAQADGQAKLQLENKVAEAKLHYDLAVSKLAELKQSNHDRWEKIQSDFEALFENLNKVVD